MEWICAILEDQRLIAQDIGLRGGRSPAWLDLRQTDALEDYLTNPDRSGHASLKSWSGRADREVSTDTL